VVEAADPGYYSLDAHAEAGVGDTAVFVGGFDFALGEGFF